MTVVLEALKAMGGIALVLALWLAVQRAWCAVFPRAAPDALAGRSGCRDCTCLGACENEPERRAASPDTR